MLWGCFFAFYSLGFWWGFLFGFEFGGGVCVFLFGLGLFVCWSGGNINRC